METTQPTPIEAIQRLTLPEVESRLDEIRAEEAQLSVLRRSLLARERAPRLRPRKQGAAPCR